jgi:ring-1,2-phenylacetyl-CoA epoxidase subunit PaaD
MVTEGVVGLPSEADVWKALEGVMDPEIPVVSVVDLRVARKVEVDGRHARVTITPTFAGCPALSAMRELIHSTLIDLGFETADVAVRFDPPWTTDDLPPETLERLRDFGLSPPPKHGGNVRLVLDQPAACPYCGSDDTEVKNAFGSTACRSIHVCRSCNQPFEAFKPL